MTTLRDLKKRTTLTNADIGAALGCSAAKAGSIIGGRDLTLSDEKIQRLARLPGVTFERCWSAMCESNNELQNTPGMQHQRASEMQAEAMAWVAKKLDLPLFPAETPRELTVVESALVVPESRRIEETH